MNKLFIYISSPEETGGGVSLYFQNNLSTENTSCRTIAPGKLGLTVHQPKFPMELQFCSYENTKSQTLWFNWYAHARDACKVAPIFIK